MTSIASARRGKGHSTHTTAGRILRSRPTNLAFRDGYRYAATLGRNTITRARVGRAGKPLANE